MDDRGDGLYEKEDVGAPKEGRKRSRDEFKVVKEFRKRLMKTTFNR